VQRYQALATGAEPHTVLARARLAQQISNNGRAHHRHLLEAGADWKTVYRDVRPLERQALFATLSSDEKHLLRTAQQYRHVNRQFGKTFSQFKAQATPLSSAIRTRRQHRLNRLGAKRDQLAFALKDKLELRHFVSAFTGETQNTVMLDKLLALNAEKISRQAEQHQWRVRQAEEVVAADNAALRHLQGIMQPPMAEEERTLRLADWLLMQHDHDELRKAIARRPDSYRYAFLEAGLTPEKAASERTAIESAKAAIAHLATVSFASSTSVAYTEDERIKMRKAQRIEKESRCIIGTLAERYLREHRGIAGAIPESLRFHPGLTHFETGKKYPALIAIAKNENGVTQAVQAVYLDAATAHKATDLSHAKLTHGLLAHGRLGVLIHKGKNAQTIALAEGPETALSVAQAQPDMTIYATLGCANFKRAPITKDTKTVLFCADNDSIKHHSTEKTPSQRQLESAATALAKHGLSVYQTMPATVKDFNDVLKQGGIAAVNAELEKTTLVKGSKTATQTFAELNAEIAGFTPEHQAVSGWKQIMAESQPIEGTLAERYLREHCLYNGEIPANLKFHPAVLEPKSTTCYPALIGIMSSQQSGDKGVLVTYLDNNTGDIAPVSTPKSFLLEDNALEVGIPIQKVKNNTPIILTSTIETALLLKSTDNSLRVLATGSIERLAKPPITGRGQAIILCLHKTIDDEKLLHITDTLLQKGFKPTIIAPELTRTFKELIVRGDKAAILNAVNNPVPVEKIIDKEIIQVIAEFKRLTDNVVKSKESQYYHHQVMAKEKLEQYAREISRNATLSQRLSLKKPALSKELQALTIEQVLQ
jgi:hypothetical protein